MCFSYIQDHHVKHMFTSKAIKSVHEKQVHKNYEVLKTKCMIKVWFT